MGRETDTMRILSRPGGMGGVRRVAELTGVRGAERAEGGRPKVEYAGEMPAAAAGFIGFGTGRGRTADGTTGIYIAGLSQAGAIAVRRGGREKRNRRSPSQATGKGGRFSTGRDNHSTDK